MTTDFTQLSAKIKAWGTEFGFQQVGISDLDLSAAEEKLQIWLQKKYHGSLHYMEKHGSKRTRPAELVPGTLRIISVRMDYLPPETDMRKNLKNPQQAYLSCYALGRDYHKVIRKRLQQFADKIHTEIHPHHYRAFVDSAPVMEKPIAVKAGLGWQGKNTLILNKKVGSYFFLGEIYTDLPLPIDQPVADHCGTCVACIDICPTQAIVAPYQLDARRCISYLTIENRGVIAEEFRAAIGNRIFGCDDCQLICPWNKFAKFTQEKDFHPRHTFKNAALLDLFTWTESEFLQKTEGSAIRRAGYEGWLRNIAIALGNAPSDPAICSALQQKLPQVSAMVREHIVWALARQQQVC